MDTEELHWAIVAYLTDKQQKVLFLETCLEMEYNKNNEPTKPS